MEVTVTVDLISIEGKKLTFSVEARDEAELISKGRHERFIVDRARFESKVGRKIKKP